MNRTLLLLTLFAVVSCKKGQTIYEERDTLLGTWQILNLDLTKRYYEPKIQDSTSISVKYRSEIELELTDTLSEGLGADTAQYRRYFRFFENGDFRVTTEYLEPFLQVTSNGEYYYSIRDVFDKYIHLSPKSYQEIERMNSRSFPIPIGDLSQLDNFKIQSLDENSLRLTFTHVRDVNTLNYHSLKGEIELKRSE